ncbi:MAG TPA: Glu/Leu/Phe/Val dehydrogenase dimerization domain-containing protein [Actinomycetota bacterium]|nr:Glu/Leu/Phe/Val dehydrogenase dimerization domain-containing protein [Actinomycetota bacterium]
MGIHRLTTVDGFIAFDFDDARFSGGGTRFAPDVTEHEASLLARAMTYKFGVLGLQAGGAKGAVRGTPEQKKELIARYCEEVRPLVESRRFGTGPDLGTSEEDFAPIRDRTAPPSPMAGTINGEAVEDLITGFGVVVAAETAMGSVDGLAFAIEGFGKVGGGVAREAVRRGARVVAVSTIEGCLFDPVGLDVEALMTLRRAHGDAFVRHAAGRFEEDPKALFSVDADVLVPGARTGVITAEIANGLKTRWIVPAANVPYTADAIEVLRSRRVSYLADFVCNVGATAGYTSNAKDVGELFGHVARTITSLQAKAGGHPSGPYEGACAIAEDYLRSWRGDDGMPDGPPLA